MNAYHDAQKFVSWRDEMWKKSYEFTGLFEGTGSLAVMDFFLKGNRGNEFYKFLDNPDYEPKMDESLASNYGAPFMQLERLDMNKMRFNPSRVDEEPFFHRKIVVNELMEEGTLGKMNRVDKQLLREMLVTKENEDLFKPMIDLPGGIEILLENNSTVVQQWQDAIWQNDEVKDYLVRRTGETDNDWDTVETLWLTREEPGSDRRKINYDAIGTILSIGNEKLARGLMHAIGTSLDAARKNDGKLFSMINKFSIEGNDAVKKGMLEEIDWLLTVGKKGGVFSKKRKDCKILKNIKRTATGEKLVDDADRLIRSKCKRVIA